MGFSAELQGISKAYNGKWANQDISFQVRKGTVHALLGENGAGKSTAMKILYGMVKPDSGKILIDEREVEAWNSHLAIEYGIGMVHQHFMLAQSETVHDNIVLGQEKNFYFFPIRNRKKERDELLHLMQQTGLKVPLEEPVRNLSVGLQSRCEILKVLYRNSKFLILDEPTAVLTPQEIEDFLSTIKKLKEQQSTILIVTHKLREIMAVADEVTILRQGKVIACKEVAQTSIEELSDLMVGRRLHLPRVKKKEKKAEQVFDLPLYKGEITGIAGVEGNGQEELVEKILSRFSREKIALIPADRHKEGLVLPFKLFENLRLGRRLLKEKSSSHFADVESHEKDLLEEFDVRPSTPDKRAFELSGGNQQKLIVARELGDLPKDAIIIATHPTRGVDLGAIEFIHTKILEASDRGHAVLLISSELEELMSLSHRIGVLYRKEIVTWFEGPHYNEKQIGYAMLSGGK